MDMIQLLKKHQDTNVKTVKRRLKKIRIIILKIKQTNYSEINNAPKYGEPIKFQKLFSIKESDKKELDNMTLALDYIGSNKLKNLTPKLSIYLENNNIIIAKSFDNK